jgi:hypothetical protein
MYQMYGAKVISLIRGGLNDTGLFDTIEKFNPFSDGRLNVEKSAEVIVP